MHLINATGMQVGYTMATDPSARDHIVVAIKGTFAFPRHDGDVCEIAEEQQPLTTADEFCGAPAYSSVRYETDFALRKLRCDVLLNASAYAPEGHEATKVKVGIKIGRMMKVFDVIGDRMWMGGVFSRITSPVPFRVMPITYDRAFGGIDNLDSDEATPDAYAVNPVGRGWHRTRNRFRMSGAQAPNTEDPADPVRVPWGNYRPMSLGVVGRSWPQRYRHAGTYDRSWIDNVFPFLPADFNELYFQAAPEDQQIEYPRGGEEIILFNLVPEGRIRFRLPNIKMPVCFFHKDGSIKDQQGLLDTILIEPDRRRLILTWRASVALKRNVFEIPEAVVGQMSMTWWRARAVGKNYYRSLAELVQARCAEGRSR